MIVLDTNVVSELMRRTPAVAVAAWVRAREPGELFTTAVTLAEIRYGIERLPASRRKESLQGAAEAVFAPFGQQVLAFDGAAAVRYATIVSRRERTGVPINAFDAQIAAVCRTHRAALATRNGTDFQGTDIDVVDPWELS